MWQPNSQFSDMAGPFFFCNAHFKMSGTIITHLATFSYFFELEKEMTERKFKSRVQAGMLSLKITNDCM